MGRQKYSRRGEGSINKRPEWKGREWMGCVEAREICLIYIRLFGLIRNRDTTAVLGSSKNLCSVRP